VLDSQTAICKKNTIINFLIVAIGGICLVQYSLVQPLLTTLIVSGLALIAIWFAMPLKANMPLYIIILGAGLNLPYPHIALGGATLGIINIVKSLGMDLLGISKVPLKDIWNIVLKVREAKFFLIYLLISFISILYSQDKANGLKILSQLLHPFVVYILLFLTIKKQNDLYRIIKIMLFGGALTVAFNIFKIFSGQAFSVAGEGTYRLDGAAGLGGYAFFLLVLIIVCYSLYVKYKKKRLLIMASVFSIFLIMTGTRSAMLALLITFSFLQWILKKRIRLVVVPFLLALILLFLPSSFNRFVPGDVDYVTLLSEINKGNYDKVLYLGNWEGRVKIWDSGVNKFFFKSPLWGNGLGASSGLTGSYYLGNKLVRQVAAAHNEYVRNIIETGIIGIVSYLTFIFLFLKRALKIYRISRSPFTKALAMSSAASLISYMTVSITEATCFFFYQFGALVWALAALANKAAEISEKQMSYIKI